MLAFANLGAQDLTVPQLPREVERLDRGRFTFFALPRDVPLARSLLEESLAHDTFPGLSRPVERATVVIAPDARRFHQWIGPSAPEWGAAVAIPELHRIVMQGSRASSSAGDPRATLRHELAHLALHESMGDLPPRWFDEGYASFSAGESGRDEFLATNLALVFRGVPSLNELDALFGGGESRAQEGYALSQRAVAELAGLDPARGLSLFFGYWRETRSLDQSIRRAFGATEVDFEAKWKAATRRRYGALALVADVTLASLLVLVVIGPLWLIRRQRDRQRLAVLRAADEAQDARDRQSVLEAILAQTGDREPAAGDEASTRRATFRADDEHIK
ncbi:MAG: hypothetical protein ACHQQ3_04615 [Gemmatimonadales bacterium]